VLPPPAKWQKIPPAPSSNQLTGAWATMLKELQLADTASHYVCAIVVRS